MSTEFYWIAVAVVTTLSSARITRLITWDSFPPSVRVRMLWDRITRDGEWALLVHCGYCFGLWAAGFVVLWGYLSDFNTAWWLFNGWLGAGYLAAIVMANDGEDGED
jgi:hypothetical protein